MAKYRDPLSATFAALADPTRRAMLERLSAGSASVSELAAAHRISMPAISKHLSVLEAAHLVRRERAGRVRRCTLTPAPLEDAGAWIAHYLDFWSEQIDALAEFLESGEDLS